MAVKKAVENFSKSLIHEVYKWGSMKQTGVTLRYMMEFGSKTTDRNLLISAQFLHKELPIRIVVVLIFILFSFYLSRQVIQEAETSELELGAWSRRF